MRPLFQLAFDFLQFRDKKPGQLFFVDFFSWFKVGIHVFFKTQLYSYQNTHNLHGLHVNTAVSKIQKNKIPPIDHFGTN